MSWTAEARLSRNKTTRIWDIMERVVMLARRHVTANTLMLESSQHCLVLTTET